MPTNPIHRIESSCVALHVRNVDTDQIIPARFLTTTERTGLGKHAFHDWRYEADGSPDPTFVLNRPSAHGARILVAGPNFGCGSSREHAVWALLGAGIEAVISSQFADIFRGNALANGLLPVELPEDVVASLVRDDAAGRIVAIDLAQQHVRVPSGDLVPFAIAPFARHRLLHGIDEMDFLLQAVPAIDAYERGAS